MTKEGFYMTPKTAEVFFRVCSLYHIELYKDRVSLMRKMAAKNKVKYIRDAEEFMKGKKVLKIIPKRTTPNE